MNRGKRKRSSDVAVNNNSGSEDEDLFQGGYLEEEDGGVRIGGIYIPPPPVPACNFVSNSARMIINSIVLTNFKSYAGQQTLGPFHKCFTSIIGPNGSGKSNVIDAMLFVFGYRSSKIRTKQMSRLIHNTGENPPNFCVVEVHLIKILNKEGDDYEEVPNSSVVLSRTAFRDNTSFYEINKRRVPFKEVAKLLRENGIDLDHNRFLILQGEVEQISQMKSKAQNEHETGMLEYLEDVIGTRRLKIPLMRIYQSYEKLNEDRINKIQKVNLSKDELKEIMSPYEEAIQFLRLENEITELNNIYCQKYIYDAEIAQKQKEEKREAVIAEIETLTKELEEATHERKEKEQILSEQQKRKEKLNKKLETLKDTFNKIDAKDVSLQAEMVEINNRRKKNKSQLTEEKRKLIELGKVPERNAADLKQIEDKLKKLNGEKEHLEIRRKEALEIIARETKSLQEKREVLEKELMPLNKKAEETKAAYKLAESELTVFVKAETDAASKLETLNATLEAKKASLTEKQRQVSEIKKMIPKTEKDVQDAQSDLNDVKNEIQGNTDRLQSMRNKVEENRSSVQKAKFRGRVLESIMQQKNSGNIPGIYGRLGDLGAIDVKYDVAISTACGPLDHIIVEDVATAEKCIAYLKNNKVGRANFIALNKQAHFLESVRTRIETPENVPRLFDLIHCNDERVKTAFYYGLRNTLVAENLEQATRIAYGNRRYRVVTLGGDLIEITGTMSGGGNVVSRGRMGQKVLVDTSNRKSATPGQLAKLESHIVELTEKIERLRDKENSLEQQVNHLNGQLNEMRMNFKRFSAEIKSLAQQIADIEDQVTAQKQIIQSTKSDKNQIKKLEKAIAEKLKLYDEAKASALEVQQKVNEISDEIKEKSDNKLKKIQKELKEKIEIIEKLKTENTRLQVGIRTAERNSKKCADRIENLELEIESAEKHILEIQEQRKEIETDARQMMQSIESVENQIDEAENDKDCEQLKIDISELTTKENDYKSKQIDTRHKLSTIVSTVNEYKKQISHWKDKLSKLKLHTIPSNDMVEINNSTMISDETEDVHSTNAQQTTLDMPSTSSSTAIVDTIQKLGLKVLTKEELEEVDLPKIQGNITYQTDKLAKKKPNLNIIAEYKKIQKIYLTRMADVEDVTNRRNEMRDLHERVKKQREEEFMKGYHIINLKVKEMYQTITLGGDAELELVDSLDPFSEGISFNVRPPRKCWKNISNLSGGEKTLSSLALVFALHYYKPSPLYVMDEIDAALDFKNVSIIGNYIKDRTGNCQFIIISLRSYMFELANRLVGIYKTNNKTKSTTINPQLYITMNPRLNPNPTVAATQSTQQSTIVRQPMAELEGEETPDRINDEIIEHGTED